MGFMSTGPTPAEQDARNAANAQAGDMQASGQAYSNYRQFNRDNNANQLSNRASLYQGLINRMQSGYGEQGSPNLSQMQYNPMGLAQTTVGATKYSNAAGSTSLDSNGIHVNEGIIDQMGLSQDAARMRAGQGAIGSNRAHDIAVSQGRDLQPGESASDVTVTPMYQGLDPNINNLNINTQNGMAPNPYQPQGGGGGQFNFAPRRQ